jgi:hypothetical protein
VDSQGFAARAPPLQRLTELPRCLLRCLLADAGQILLSRRRHAVMRRCGEDCYVVDIYWTGLLRGRYSETLAIVENARFQRDFRGLRGPPRTGGRRMIFCCTKKSVDPGCLLSGDVVSLGASRKIAALSSVAMLRNLCARKASEEEVRSGRQLLLPSAFEG